MRYPKDDETAQEVIDLALTVGCDYHPAEYGPCSHCVEAAERVVDAGYVSPEVANARMADVWDEGFKAGGQAEWLGHDEDEDAHTRNPCRAAEPTDGETVMCAWCGQQHTMAEETHDA